MSASRITRFPLFRRAVLWCTTLVLLASAQYGVQGRGAAAGTAPAASAQAVTQSVGTLDTVHYIPPLFAPPGVNASAVQNHYLVLSTPEASSFVVKISNKDGFSRNVTISRNNPQTVNLSEAPYGASRYDSLGIVTETDLNQVNRTDGLILKADLPFYAVVRHIALAHADSLTAKGQTALGTQFRAGFMWMDESAASDSLDARSQFISVIASQNDTVVSFGDIQQGLFFRQADGTRLAGPPASVTLDRGESYVVAVRHADIDRTKRNKLNGALVTATKPIAMNSGSWVGGALSDGNDIGFDQSLPASLVGTKYLLAMGNATTLKSQLEVPVVIAHSDNTQVFVNGSATPLVTLNAGEYHAIPGNKFTAAGTMFIRTSRPAYVYQTTAGANDSANLGMSIAVGLSDAIKPQDVVIGNVNQGGASAEMSIIVKQGASVSLDCAGPMPTGVTSCDLGAAEVVDSLAGYRIRRQPVFGDVFVSSPEPMFISLTTRDNVATAAAYFSGVPNTYAVDDTAVTGLNTPVVVPVMANDNTGAGEFTITSTSGPANGRRNVQQDGTIRYTPDDGFSGTDQFDYTISSGTITSTATVTVTVLPNVYNFTQPAFQAPQPQSATTTHVVTVVREGDLSVIGEIEVSLFPGAGNPATAGQDYVDGPIAVTFAPGQDTASVPIRLRHDPTNTTEEMISLALTGAGVGQTQSTATLTLTLNADPVANAGPDQSVPATSPAGAQVTLDGAASADPDGDPLTYTWRNNASVIIGTGATINTTVPLGTHAFRLTVTDGRGGSSTNTVNVTVFDSLSIAIARPIAGTTYAYGQAVAASYSCTSSAGLLQACVGPVASGANLNTSSLGPHEFDVTATNTLGNTSSTTVWYTVTNSAPTFTAPPNQTVEATSASGAVVTYSATGNDVEDGAIAAVCAPASGATFPLGTTAVSCTVTDSAGAAASGSFNVTVIDTMAPVIAAPANTTVSATSVDGATVTYAAPAASDLVDPSPAVSCAPTSGSTFAIGTTPVTCVSTDASGNSASAAFVVTVANSCIVTSDADAGWATLRGKIADASCPVITFDPGVSHITLTSGELRIQRDVIINGTGPQALTIDGGGVFRVFHNDRKIVAISGLTITGGKGEGRDGDPSWGGGGVLSWYGVTRLTDVVLTKNTAIQGGGIQSEGNSAALILTRVALVDNTSANSGGGVLVRGGTTFTIRDSSATGNTAVRGGAIHAAIVPFDMVNSTVAGNTSSSTYGAVYLPNGGVASITNSTVVGNSTAPGGVGVWAANTASVTFKNSIVAANGSQNCLAPAGVQVLGTNLSDDASCVGFTQVTDVRLKPLADNGGPTQTMALKPGSPAIDAAVDCTDTTGASVTTDQRGVARPQMQACDVGAFEGTADELLDVEAPVFGTTPNLHVGATSSAGSVVTYSVTAVDDVDAEPVVACIPASGTTFGIGATTVTCTASDTAGNTASSTFTVTVTNNAPTVEPHQQLVVEATGPDGAEVVFDVVAVDVEDGSIPATCTPASGTIFPMGNTEVSCSATDSAGVTSGIMSFSVWVRDTTAPVLAPAPNIVVPATSLFGAPVTYDLPAVSDLVDPSPVVTCAPASGSMFAMGVTPVLCSAQDASGNRKRPTKTFTVTVVNTAPTLSVPPDMTVEATSAAGATVTFTATGNDVEDGVIVPICSPESGSTFALGTRKVVCGVKDMAGAKTSGAFFVTVVDTAAPSIAPTADISISATSAAGAVVTYTVPETSDLVDGAGVATCLPASGSTFPLGATTVTCTASDAALNSASSTFTVTVTNTAPTVAAPANQTIEATSAAGAVATFTATGNDVEDGALDAVCTSASGSPFALGTTTVTCTVTDSAGATATGTFAVTVVDTTAPTFAVPADVSFSATSPAGAVVTYMAPVTSDLVDGAGLATCSPASGSTFPLGVTTVTCTATDAAGNTTSANVTVTVTNTAPVCTLTPSITSIWPVNHQLVPVTASGATDVDGGPLTYTVVSIFQDEPTNTQGDGNTGLDGQGVGTSTAWVRAERMGSGAKSNKSTKGGGNGRVYHITFSVTDALGLSCTETVKVGVPHDQRGGPAIDDGALYDSTVAPPLPPKSDKSRKSGKSGKSDKSDKSDKSEKSSKSDKSTKAPGKKAPASKGKK